MKLLSLSFLFLCLSFSANSFAQEAPATASYFKETPGSIEDVPVDQELSFTLMGRGLKDKKSPASLALVCTTRDCHTLRFLYIRGGNSTQRFFLGPRYDYVGEKDLNSTDLTDEAKKILKESATLDHRSYEKPLWVIFGGAMIGTGLLIAHVYGIGFILDAIFFGSATVIGLTGQTTATHILKAMDIGGTSLNNKDEAKVFYNQDGWNWGVKPIRISHDDFYAYLCKLVGPTMRANAETNVLNEKAVSAGFMCFVDQN